MKFQKPPLDLPQQLQKWQSRGLAVADPAAALHYLRFIGYYRLSAYALPLQQAIPPLAAFTGQPASSAPPAAAGPDKPFKPGTTFQNILNLYIFDRELRLLVIDAIERIEVALRACVVNEMAVRHGAHWFMDQALFSPQYRHLKLIEKIEAELGIPASGTRPQSPHHERFINHYYAKYTDIPTCRPLGWSPRPCHSALGQPYSPTSNRRPNVKRSLLISRWTSTS